MEDRLGVASSKISKCWMNTGSEAHSSGVDTGRRTFRPFLNGLDRYLHREFCPFSRHREQTGWVWSHASLDDLQGSQAGSLTGMLRPFTRRALLSTGTPVE
jgi:hypothetical protein